MKAWLAVAAAVALAACHPADAGGAWRPPAGGAPCGGVADPACPDGTFCWKDRKAAAGADMRGQCKPPPTSCPAGHAPVCGADLKTYETACQAAMNGVNVLIDGACPPRR